MPTCYENVGHMPVKGETINVSVFIWWRKQSWHSRKFVANNL